MSGNESRNQAIYQITNTEGAYVEETEALSSVWASDAFTLAKEKAPAIIFIDQIDAIGTKRFDSEKSGDREVQRTMLELLNQLDGFSSVSNVKIIAATNRADILDPALMRSGTFGHLIILPKKL